MTEVAFCPECMVPRQITNENQWLSNGVIILKSNPLLRRAFVKSDNLDPLFTGIEKLTGTPIEHLLINAECRGTRDYYNSHTPQEVKDRIHKLEIPFESVVDTLETIHRIYGLGRFEVKEFSYRNDDSDYMRFMGYDIYSVPLVIGDIMGAGEALVGKPLEITTREVSQGVHEMNATISQAPLKPESNPGRKEHRLREGDIELERCFTCGGPAALSEYRWNVRDGIIRSETTDKRMVFFESSVLDPVFKELEKELGKTIPRVVVEAQRRFTKTGFYSIHEITDEDRFRADLALRGSGNLREFRMGARGLRFRLDNVCMPLMWLGMVQGLFELVYDKDSTIDWELTQDGDLIAEVIPLFARFLYASEG